VIFKALAKDPQQRFPNILAFSSALEHAGQALQRAMYTSTKMPVQQATKASPHQQSIPPTILANAAPPLSLQKQLKDASIYADTKVSTQQETFISSRQRSIPPTIPEKPPLILPSPQKPLKDNSVIHEKFRKRFEEKQSGIEEVLGKGTIIVCTEQKQDKKTVVKLLNEEDWIKDSLVLATERYVKNYPFDDQMISAAIFQGIYANDYMIWIHPDHPKSVRLDKGQTILVVL
jgi:hypothetical protein